MVADAVTNVYIFTYLHYILLFFFFFFGKIEYRNLIVQRRGQFARYLWHGVWREKTRKLSTKSRFERLRYVEADFISHDLRMYQIIAPELSLHYITCSVVCVAFEMKQGVAGATVEGARIYRLPYTLGYCERDRHGCIV